MKSAANNLAALLARSARAWPALPAVAHGFAVRSDYRALARRCASLAAALLHQGLRPGDRVALVARNHPAYIEALVACWWAGLVAVPVNAKLHPDELAFVLDDSGARWAFVDAAWADALARIASSGALRVTLLDGDEHARLCGNDASPAIAAVRANDPAWLFYTSGTTGRPKGVVISHANLLAMTQAFLCDVAPIAPGDAILHPAPLSHGSGLYVVPHLARAAAHVVPASGAFDPEEIVALLGQHAGALFFAAPTMVQRLVAHVAGNGIAPGALAHLKCVVYGGGPMYVEDARRAFAVLGPRLAQIYGQGESPMTITAMDRALLADAMARDDATRIGSVGVAQLGMEVRIADGTIARGDEAPATADDGGAASSDHGPGHIGEVLVRGPAVMQGYWRNASASAAALANGWLHTGDLGSLDAAGFLTLRDRSKDLIISGGSNIYPREVEEILLRHPDVLEAAVVGRRHPDWGEEVVACVVPRAHAAGPDAQDALAAALDALCLAHIARFKRPREYRFLAELPKNNAGKVLKTALRETVTGPWPAPRSV